MVSQPAAPVLPQAHLPACAPSPNLHPTECREREMAALVWRSYCRCADITDRLLQMLTTFDQHGQCPCKEGRNSSEEKPTEDIWAWGTGWGRYTVLETSLLDKEVVSLVCELCHDSDKLPIPRTLNILQAPSQLGQSIPS